MQRKRVFLLMGFWAHRSLAFNDGSLLDGFRLLSVFRGAVENGEIFGPLAMAFCGGLLASLSPCVYPLIPITLSVMGARAEKSALQGFLVSSCYVLGMSVTYALLGTLFATAGIMLGSLMQHPIMVFIFAGLFFIFALSMFGIFELVLPSRMMTYLSRLGGHGKRGAFAMGLVAGVVAAPCTGPILGFILALIAGDQNIELGISLMVLFSLGIGTPFLLLGTFSSAIARMPKSGSWMTSVKYLFGAVMLGAAVYYAALASKPVRILFYSLATAHFFLIVAVLIFGLGLLLFSHHAMSHQIIGRCQVIFGALFSSVTIAILLCDGGIPSKVEATTNLDGVRWHVIAVDTRSSLSFDELVNMARAEGKPIMVDFYADWCVLCKQLEEKTFKDGQVASKLREFFLIKIDSTKTSKTIEAILNRFGVTGLPALVFLDKQGHVIHDAKVFGFIEKTGFLNLLNSVGEH